MIVATFIGRDGICGFKYGETYTLKEPDNPNNDWKIMIEDFDDCTRWCSYNTIEAFLNHWYVLRCI